MKIYLVGGAVRDTLLGIDPKDKDYVVTGATEQQMLDLGYTKVGADFPVFLHPVTREEYALARKERKTGTGYNGFTVTFDPTVTLEEDLIRRDLTINSMAMDENGIIIDPYGGQQDIRDCVLRHTSEAFADDPVRVLRTCRFAARYVRFTVAPETVLLMQQIVHELDYVPQERIWAELEKGLMEKAPFTMIAYLIQANAFNTVAMHDYSHGHLPLSGIAAAPLYARAAWLMIGWSDDMYAKHCIPNEVSTVSKAFNKYGNRLRNYALLSPTNRLQLLYDFRVFSNKVGLQRCLQVLEMEDRTWYHDQSFEQIDRDIDTIQRGVDVKQIVDQCGGKGDAIHSALFAARLKCIMDPNECQED